VKGKGKASDPTPEALGGGRGNPPGAPREQAAGAPGGGGGGDSDDEGKGSGRKPNESRKGRRDERLAHQPEDNYDAENDKQFNLFTRVMVNALGQRTRVPAQPSALFRNEKHQNIGMWLLTWTDYFSRNSWLWQEEAQRI